MHYYWKRRIYLFIKGFRKFPSLKEVREYYQYYRNEVMDVDVINDNMTSEDFSKLLHMVRFLRGAAGTAIQAAFCLGFKAGKGGAV